MRIPFSVFSCSGFLGSNTLYNPYEFISKGKTMPKFEAIPLSEAKLKSATGKRAQITQEYLAYIKELQAGQAGRLQPAEGETVAAIRRRLGAAAKLFSKPVTIKREGNEVFFWVQEQKRTTRRGRRKSE